MKTKNIISILFLITIFLQTACDDSVISIATNVSLSEQNIELNQGTSKTLVATANVDEVTLFWTSSNPNIATVDQNGLVTAISGGTCVINCRVMNGINVTSECQVTVNKTSDHAWVDLGLPSGTLWATCNVGADKPEEYGSYFAWGETDQKTNYDWSNYKYSYYLSSSSSYRMSKYCTSSDYGSVDYKTELDPVDDAATANWGSEWQMPSEKQICELMNVDYTRSTYITSNEKSGVMIVSRINGSQIFLPCAGIRDATYSYSGYYWSRSLGLGINDRYAETLSLESGFSPVWGYKQRYYGCSVRPVRVKVE